MCSIYFLFFYSSPTVPEGGCWITGPFLTGRDAVSCQPLPHHPHSPGKAGERQRRWWDGRDEYKEGGKGSRDGETEEPGGGGGWDRGGRGVFRLIGGRRWASSPPRADGWNLWAVSAAPPLKDFLSDHDCIKGKRFSTAPRGRRRWWGDEGGR